MKFGDFFDKEWVCYYVDDPCYLSDVNRRGPLHKHCGWRYRADINEYEYEALKDARLVK